LREKKGNPLGAIRSRASRANHLDVQMKSNDARRPLPQGIATGSALASAQAAVEVM
jgi:hypothetical protein